MDYIQFFTLFGTMLTGFGFMYKEFKSIEKDLRAEIRTQAGRSDQLYTMFIDLLKKDKEKQTNESTRRTAPKV